MELENAFRTNLAVIATTGIRSIDPTGALAARPLLGDDQRAVVTAVTGSTAGVHVLVGHAGTGKTYRLGAVREAFETAGYTVIGLAPSARAARVGGWIRHRIPHHRCVALSQQRPHEQHPSLSLTRLRW